MSETNLYDIPQEILLNIFKRLKLSDLGNLMLCCKYLHDFIKNESILWKFICRGRFIISSNEKRDPLTWYHKGRISYNWCKGIFKPKLIIQHSTNFIPWLKLVSDVLLLSIGSELQCYAIDKTGYSRGLLWTIQVPTIERHDVRNNDITRFILKENFIVCGNRDGSTVIYHFHDIHKKPTLLHYIQNCHLGGRVEVTAVELWNNCLITGSRVSPCVCFWPMDHATLFRQILNEANSNTIINNENPCKNMYAIPNTVGTRSLAIDPNKTKLAIGPNGNSKPLLFDINKSDYILKCTDDVEIKYMIRDIQWHDENGIVYVSHAGRLQYFDVRTNNVEYDTRDPFQSSLYCVKTDGDNAVVVGSAEYARCVLYDLRSPHHVQLYFTQKKSSPVYSLDFDARKLIAAADRGVAVMNFNVNASNAKKKDYSHIFQYVR